jgi:hypothetical protein
MSIKEFLDNAQKSVWVNAQRCNQGDILTITSQPTIDDKTFPGRSYLVMDVRLERTRETLKLRLSPNQTYNLIGVLGDDAKSWIGKKIKVAGKVNYPGLGKEGLIYIPA